MSVSNFKNMGFRNNFKGFDSFEFLKKDIKYFVFSLFRVFVIAFIFLPHNTQTLQLRD
jgi:hypothetical protein